MLKFKPLNSTVVSTPPAEGEYLLGHTTSGEGVRVPVRFPRPAIPSSPDLQSIPSSLIPSDNNTYNLGKLLYQAGVWAKKIWKSVFAEKLVVYGGLIEFVKTDNDGNPAFSANLRPPTAETDVDVYFPNGDGTLARVEDMPLCLGEAYVRVEAGGEAEEGPGQNVNGYTLSAFDTVAEIGSLPVDGDNFLQLSQWAPLGRRVVVFDDEFLCYNAGAASRWKIKCEGNSEDLPRIDGQAVIPLQNGVRIELQHVGAGRWVILSMRNQYQPEP